MSRPLSADPAADPVKPWYRQAWPWGLILGPAVVVVACIYTTWLAVKTTDPMVVDDYYKQGLAVNRSIERDQAAARGGLQAILQFEADGMQRIRLGASTSQPWPDAVQLVLAHPAKAERDRVITLHVEHSDSGGARYVSDTRTVLDAVAYQLILEDMARTWRLTGKVKPARQQQLQLNPLPVQGSQVLQ